MSKDQFQLSMNTYYIHKGLTTPADIRSTLQRLFNIGYPNIDLAAVATANEPFVRQVADELGMHVYSTQNGFDALFDEQRIVSETMAKHWALGSRFVNVGNSPEKFRGPRANYRLLAKQLEKAGRTLKKAGFTLSFHPYGHDNVKIDHETGLEILIGETDGEFLKFELDTGNHLPPEHDLVPMIQRLGGRMDLAILKDFQRGAQGELVSCSLGEGNVYNNWPQILRELRASGVTCCVVEFQDSYPGDIFDGLAKSKKFVESHW